MQSIWSVVLYKLKKGLCPVEECSESLFTFAGPRCFGRITFQRKIIQKQDMGWHSWRLDILSYFFRWSFHPLDLVWLDFDNAGLAVYFIEPLHPDKFFWRGQLYGENDDFTRFSYFSRAALELLLQAGKKPDIIHCHDWQTAFVVRSFLKDRYFPLTLCSFLNILIVVPHW